MLFLNLTPVARLIEHWTSDQKVLGSNHNFWGICVSLYFQSREIIIIHFVNFADNKHNTPANTHTDTHTHTHTHTDTHHTLPPTLRG